MIALKTPRDVVGSSVDAESPIMNQPGPAPCSRSARSRRHRDCAREGSGLQGAAGPSPGPGGRRTKSASIDRGSGAPGPSGLVSDQRRRVIIGWTRSFPVAVARAIRRGERAGLLTPRARPSQRVAPEASTTICVAIGPAAVSSPSCTKCWLSSRGSVLYADRPLFLYTA
jgi:hypothetical protein